MTSLLYMTSILYITRCVKLTCHIFLDKYICDCLAIIYIDNGIKEV